VHGSLEIDSALHAILGQATHYLSDSLLGEIGKFMLFSGQSGRFLTLGAELT
jgi:hypothetical protein